ncbi:MAG: hypothetical protein AB9907_17630 [Flexilinea sp.]
MSKISQEKEEKEENESELFIGVKKHINDELVSIRKVVWLTKFIELKQT